MSLAFVTRRDFRLLKHLQLFQVRRFELHNKAADIRYNSNTGAAFITSSFVSS
jgi:hypothetical protein